MAMFRRLLGVSLSLTLGRAELFPNPFKVFVEHSEEVDVLIVAEERIYIIGLSQNVSAPAIQHSELQKGCQVFRLVA